jgi:hypothetical protein
MRNVGKSLVYDDFVYWDVAGLLVEAEKIWHLLPWSLFFEHMDFIALNCNTFVMSTRLWVIFIPICLGMHDNIFMWFTSSAMYVICDDMWICHHS